MLSRTGYFIATLIAALLLVGTPTDARAQVTETPVRITNDNPCNVRVSVQQLGRTIKVYRVDSFQTLTTTLSARNGERVSVTVERSGCADRTRYALDSLMPMSGFTLVARVSPNLERSQVYLLSNQS